MGIHRAWVQWDRGDHVWEVHGGREGNMREPNLLIAINYSKSLGSVHSYSLQRTKPGCCFLVKEVKERK